MIVAGGGISLDGQRWVSCRPRFLLPVPVFSKLFPGADASSRPPDRPVNPAANVVPTRSAARAIAEAAAFLHCSVF